MDSTHWIAGLARELADTPDLWQPLVKNAAGERWYEPLLVDDRSEAWLMGWPAWERIELHDHGGSAGAFTVVQGSLQETWIARTAGRLRRRRLRPGDLVAFDENHVHDVVGTSKTQALSIHVYSPRLRTLNFYEAHWGGRLELLRTDPSGVEFAHA